MIHIQIDEPYQTSVDQTWLLNAARTTLTAQKVPSKTDLSIVVSDDRHLQALNQQFLGIDAPTDVLSFPSEDSDPDSGNRYLGDIILSYPRALEQAQAGGHPVQAELQLLVVHGLLHLLGFDHSEAAEKERMWSAQSGILQTLGSPIRGPANE